MERFVEWLRGVFWTWSGDGIIFWLINSGLGLIMRFFLCNNESGEIFCYLRGLFSGPEGVFD